MKYDSTADTLKHIRLVGTYLIHFAHLLTGRAVTHDMSKLETPEKELFDELRPKLDLYPYGSAEYMVLVSSLNVGLKHHYRENSHHPEHYENGVDGMDLFDIVEMFCDWKAASERRNDVGFQDSIRISAERFQMSEQLTNIFLNTARNF